MSHLMHNNTLHDNAGTIEYVTFETKADVSGVVVERALQQTDPVLNDINGFIQRYIVRKDDGQWVEVVFWRDQASAEEGLQLFLKDPRSQALLELIREDSVDISYSEII